MEKVGRSELITLIETQQQEYQKHIEIQQRACREYQKHIETQQQACQEYEKNIAAQEKQNRQNQKRIQSLKKLADQLKAQNEELRQRLLLVDGHYIILKNKFFGKSSEKKPAKNPTDKSPKKPKKKAKKKPQLPSLRYPNAPLIERDVVFQTPPNCSCCGSGMLDSGMTEDAEFLTVTPAQYMIIRQRRHKYRCGKCHGEVQTAPSPKRIKPGSSYSDAMILDVNLSKYCDLVPIDRYATIAGREGLKDLPPKA